METGAKDDVDHDKPGESETSESEGLEKAAEKFERDDIGPEVSMESLTLGSELGSVLRPWEGKADPAARTRVKTRSHEARASNKDSSAATTAPPKAVNMDVDTNNKQLIWRKRVLLQLIEAVIKVESEITMKRSNGGGLSGASFRRKSTKWGRIANLLPVEFRGKICNRMAHYKCQYKFRNLMRAFREKTGQVSRGKSKTLKITEAEFQMLKKREDLLKARRTVRTEPMSRLHSSNTKDDESSDGQSPGFETSEEGGSFAGQSGGSGRLEDSETSSQHDRQGHIDDESDASQSEGQDRPADRQRGHLDHPKKKSIEKKTSISGLGSASKSTSESSKYVKVNMDTKNRNLRWSEPIRRQLIEAMIKVVSEVTMKRSKGGGSSRSSFHLTSTQWDRIAKFLPVEFRGKVWDSRTQKYAFYKCTRTFYNLMRAFREKSGQRSKRTSHIRRAMTKSEFKMLKKLDDLLKARCTVPAETKCKLQSSNTVDENSYSEGFGTEEGGSSSAKETGESGSLEARLEGGEKSHRYDQNGHMDDISDTSQSEGQDRFVDKGVRAHIDRTKKPIEKKTSSPAQGSSFKSRSESSGPAKRGKPVANTRSETHTQTGATTGDTIKEMGRRAGPASSSRAETNCPNSNPESSHGEHLHSFLESALRSVDLELSHLSSWMQTLAAPSVKRAMNKSTGAENLLSKKRKVNAQPRPPGTLRESSTN